MRTLLPFLLSLSLVSACGQPLARTAAAPRKAVFIILDGIPADVIERVATPSIDAIAAAGGYARAHVGGELGGPTETPTISAPGYISLLTATWANKHNVRGNSKLSPNYDYWNIFRIVESVDPSRQTAIFSTWLDNRTVLLGEGRPDAGNFRLDHAADGFERDTVAFPHDPASKYILAIDERVARTPPRTSRRRVRTFRGSISSTPTTPRMPTATARGSTRRCGRRMPGWGASGRRSSSVRRWAKSG
ncbi:MAG: alkaline phosphatase family protein [Gemmatimonadetes bacterium]|nr:alkaline phosphatase family protein [Gemmatimonadota bacterium]